MPSEFPGFIADCMLGRLSRWLRILGFDTLYFRDIEDDELLRLQKETRRTVLTRDRGLILRRDMGPCLFIKSDHWDCQLREVLKGLPGCKPASAGMFSLCPVCNGALRELEPEAVREQVPDHIWASCKYFRGCEICGRVYWPGTHRERIIKVLDRLLSETDDP